jgi:centrosomal protein CEP250
MTCLSNLLFSLALSLVEKEKRLLILQEADSVRQQELSSLRQDIQEAQEGQRELGVQVSICLSPTL